jgi:hypothetical protein
MAAENQQKSVRRARDRLAAVAEKHELTIARGKGPYIGPLAREQSGIEPRLINPFAPRLSVIEIDPDDSMFKAAGCQRSEDGRSSPVGDSMHGVAARARSVPITAERSRHDVQRGTRTQPYTTCSVR